MKNILSILYISFFFINITFGQDNVGSENSHGYLYLNGNTSNYSDSKIRFTKYSNANAHIDVWDNKSLHLNYYRGGDIYFGNGNTGAHSIFKKDGRLFINTLSSNSTYNLWVNGAVGFNNIVKINAASSNDNNSPGLTLVGNDDFLFDGEYINHYGFGFHKHNAGSAVNGYNSYISGYFGIDLFTAGHNRFRITQYGKVGVGTTEPKSLLHVSSNINGDAVLTLEADKDNNNENDNPGINMIQDGNLVNAYLGFGKTTLDNSFTIALKNDGFTGDTIVPRLTIDSRNGNVAIGTEKFDGYKLSVDGKIRATEVKVYTGWADYVFEEDYKLKPLEEVEKHIKEHKHLPDVPSAKEVEENGVNLGESDAVLLRKIEELTLYIIQQEKKIKEQAQKISFEKKRNDLLEERLHKIEILFKSKLK